jgi:hypothetical protein
MSRQAPLAASPWKSRRGIMIRTHERAEMDKHIVTPDIVRETTIEAATFVGDETSTLPDLSLDVGQDFSPLIVKAQCTWRAGKSFTLNVLQQIEDNRRPGASTAPNRLTDSNDRRIGPTPKGYLRLTHTFD